MAHSPANMNDVTLPDAWRSKPALLVAIGAISILLSLGICYIGAGADQRALGYRFFAHSYLTNFIYGLSFGLGALFFVLIQFLCRAAWSTTVRRLAEIMASTIPFMAFLFIPILFNVTFSESAALYDWNAPFDKLSTVVKEKVDYLNGPFFSVRAILCLAAWSIIALGYYRLSRRQDESGDTNLTLTMQKWSGPSVMLFAITVSVAAFDWVMSVEPEWFSTMFGVYIFAASMMGFYAMLIVLALAVQRSGRAREQITVEHYHDMGKFLFGFTFFWGYIAFSQFMLYWYANIPEETIWFAERTTGNWKVLVAILIIGHFIVPFLGLLSHHVRRNRTALGFWACFLLVMHWMDMTFLIMPNVGGGNVMLYIGHLVCMVGMVSLLLAFIIIQAGKAPIVAVRDPRVAEAMSYHNFLG